MGPVSSSSRTPRAAWPLLQVNLILSAIVSIHKKLWSHAYSHKAHAYSHKEQRRRQASGQNSSRGSVLMDCLHGDHEEGLSTAAWFRPCLKAFRPFHSCLSLCWDLLAVNDFGT